jgi:hypothetical protein
MSNFIESDLHNSRVAFLIINDEILFFRNSTMSHREWFNTLNLNLNFDEIIRGFYLNNRIIFYKGDFIFDDETITTALNFYKKIIQELKLESPEVWVRTI